MSGLEGAVYLMGSALFANIILASSMLGTEGAAGVELTAALIVAAAGLGNCGVAPQQGKRRGVGGVWL